MKLVFSDIHANRKAARFVETISKGFSEVICCGDICGYGKDFKYCIDMFKSRGIKCVLGNHDYLVLHGKELDIAKNYIDEVANPIIWTKKRIKQKELDYLASLPIQLETDSGIFVKHTLDMFDYVRTDEDCRNLIKLTKLNTITIGHTHVFREFVDGEVKVINVGSISKGRQGTKSGYVMLDGKRVIWKEYRDI